MATYPEEYGTDRRDFGAVRFDRLMQMRIVEILLVCSNYERFCLEEDGRIDEQIFEEYVALGLRYPPRFDTAATPGEALAAVKRRRYHLVIIMLDLVQEEVLELVHKIRERRKKTPIVILTRFWREVFAGLESGTWPIDHVFSWLGNANILLAIVKLLEDRLNVEHDVHEIGVQTIILVEDSVRYYSSFLPLMYRALYQQAQSIMEEGLNEAQRSLRRRSRPKVLLATSFEEAVELFESYYPNVLGVISDISFRRGGTTDRTAGLTLCAALRERDPHLPVLLQSSNPEHVRHARSLSTAFLYKNSRTLLNSLQKFIEENFGFGDFVFRMPGTLDEVGRASDLAELQHTLFRVPAESVAYHARYHHFSKWLKARALFELAKVLRPRQLEDFDSIDSLRQYLADTIENYRIDLGRGTIAAFDRDRLDQSAVFQRIGKGSLGGKARGLGFVNAFLKRRKLMFRFPEVVVQIPKTVVLTTEVFERFMESNNLYPYATAALASDSSLLRRFLAGRLPDDVRADLWTLVGVIDKPLAVRSSSLLEDSHYQPFAGVYGTYFVPNNNPDRNVRLQELCDAIKGVYASTYYEGSKEYALATHNIIDQEKMAVLVQEVTGAEYGGLYYPQISGVARSLNFYPIENERPRDGVVNIALGLGKTVVDGEVSLRFSPASPEKVLQLYSVDSALKTTQRKFYALDMAIGSFRATTDQSANLRHLDVEGAAEHRANWDALSTYDHQNNRIREDPQRPGPKLVTFSRILKYGALPLPQVLSTLLEVGSREMGVPVEIEFAVKMDVPKDQPKQFKFLQIRPIVEGLEAEAVQVGEVPEETTIVTAFTALGNGTYDGLCDVVYIKPEAFDPAHTTRMVPLIAAVNRRLADEERHYLLIGPGRWGSVDPWLGIPVKWAHITYARVIVEASLRSFRIEASQGSHFFQNITSFRVAYLTVDPSAKDGTYDVGFLDAQPAVYEDEFLRHVRFDTPVVVKVDGRRISGELKAVVLKPGGRPEAHE